MKAVVYEKARTVAVKEVDMPRIKRNQVLLKVRACGICKTDLHLYNGAFFAAFPLIPGHEFSGDVVEVGADCADVKAGDRVVADNTVLCGYCDYCKSDRPLFCDHFYSLGNNGPGGSAQYVAVNFDKVFRFQGIDYETAALAEPTACAIHGVDVIDLRFGDDVLLFGAGPTGIILAQLLKHGGAEHVAVVAPTQKKLDLLNAYGIADTVKMDKNDYSVHRKALKERFPKGFDVVIDATGHAPVLEDAIQYAKKGGKVIVYGVCEESARISVSPYELFAKEIKLIGSFAQTHCFDRAVACLESGTVQTEGMISARFTLDDYMEGLETVIRGGENIKTMIVP